MRYCIKCGESLSVETLINGQPIAIYCPNKRCPRCWLLAVDGLEHKPTKLKRGNK